MKKFLLTIFYILFTTTLMAQELTVKSFQTATTDLSARTHPRQDLNGDDCALVKVQIASAGVTFTGDVMGDVAFKNNEYWVYMTAGSKRLKVIHPSYLPLEVSFEDYGVSKVSGKTTYVLTILLGNLPQGVQQQKVQTGWILLDSDPAGASVYINDEFVGNTPLDGYKQPYGTYSYRLEMPDYHPSSGTLELNSGRLEKSIRLVPAFGAIAVSSNIGGATVLLDGKAVGSKTPCTLQKVASGRHTITVQKDKYAPRQENVMVEDGKTATVNFNLDARFATVTITSLSGAQIWSNGKQIGTTKCQEDMMEGYYDLEVRLPHHRTASRQIRVVAGQPQQIILNPTPIYGSLDITSTPRDADVTIDGKAYGKTPTTVDQLLEGSHEVVVSKQGFLSQNSTITITENKTASLAVPLKKDDGKLRITVNGISFTMIKVEAGTFQMGEEGVATPVHQVTLTNDYYIGETEVTQELWTAVMGSNPSSFEGAHLPVEMVSWSDCQEFITKLNALTGCNFRLPTEAEWEFAARGGNASKGYTYSGSNTFDDVAWYSNNSGSETHEVATKVPNELGIYDMSGNVWEWCQDWFGSYSSSAQINPSGPTSGSNHVSRGGSWYNFSYNGCRVAFRAWGTPSNADDGLGFRLALEPVEDGLPHTKTSPISLSFASTANTTGKAIAVRSNESWEATSNASWCKVSPGSGSNSGEVIVTVTANTSSDSRAATVTVKGLTSGDAATINVVQLGVINAASHTVTVNGVSFKMIKVEAGTFQMGSAYGNEKPVHQVTLTNDYYIGETEVTQELWTAVMDSNPSYSIGLQFPVERVSWNDCQTFILKLNTLTGLNFRLPTEAEWEFAARGGNVSEGYTYSGSNTIGEVAWWGGNSSSTHEVSKKTPNELGIYDMSGNVWEWCQDWYGSYYSTGDQTNPTGPTSGSNRVRRGGSWDTGSFNLYCCVTGRLSFTPSSGRLDLGFRLALQVPD